jgi:hypothetical protein
MVRALTVYDGQLIAAGEFDTAGGVPCNHIASWDGSEWRPLGIGLDASVFALVSYHGELIAGGVFGMGYIKRWNGSGWDSLGPGVNCDVLALTAYDGNLIAGGVFSY